MAISVVQSKAFKGTTGSFSAATTAGNCVLVCIMDTEFSFSDNVTAVTLGGSAGNFAQLQTAEEDSDAYVWAWADPNCAGGQTAIAVTVTNATDPVFIAYEISGLVSTGLLDKSSSGGSLTTSYSSGSTATTAQASEIWVGLASGSDNSGSMTGPSSPWTNTTSNGSGGSTFGIAGYQIVSSTGTATYAGTAPGTSAAVALVVTLKGAGGAGAPAGQVQPAATVTAPRRQAGRAVVRGAAVPGVYGTPGVQPAASRLAPRRVLARAVVLFRPVRTVNAAPPAPVAGTVQPRPTLTPPRRVLSRAVVRFTPVSTVNQSSAAGAAIVLGRPHIISAAADTINQGSIHVISPYTQTLIQEWDQ